MVTMVYKAHIGRYYGVFLELAYTCKQIVSPSPALPEGEKDSLGTFLVTRVSD